MFCTVHTLILILSTTVKRVPRLSELAHGRSNCHCLASGSIPCLLYILKYEEIFSILTETVEKGISAKKAVGELMKKPLKPDRRWIVAFNDFLGASVTVRNNYVYFLKITE